MDFIFLSKNHYKKYTEHINSKISKIKFNNFIDNYLNELHKIILLVDEKENIIGSGTIIIEHKLTYGGCKMGHIENILIDKNFRGKGYGEKLVKKLLHICNEEKCYRVDLNCSSELENFYSKNGFKQKHICMNIYFRENFK